MDMVTCSSHGLELKRIGTKLLHENGHCYMRFLMFGDETKWKTRMHTARRANHVEMACSVTIDTVTRGSHSLELKQSALSLRHADRHHCAWFPLFRAETKWNNLVTCK